MKITKSLLAAAVALAATPALAQTAPSDTITLVLEKGVTMSVAQMGITGDVTYKPDGTFSGFDGQYEGTYKVDGTKLCLTSAAVGQDNTCFDYPTGQKSGDKFKITDPNVGEIEITVK
jgi:polyisoprenoid-binding protein YceI